ncbi:16336_t:CDS:1, partial [Acaulospora colombiana]
MLKEKIEEEEDIPPKDQRLLYGGHQLEDNKTLDDYEIRKDCTIWLAMRVQGGAKLV